MLYMRAATNGPPSAYMRRNTEISEALYGVVQCLEVTLRNAIHSHMTKAMNTEKWYDAFPFQDSEMAEIQQAKSKVVERPATLTAGRVVAELKFGFWVRLFSHTYDKTLWVPHLRKLFPLKFDGMRSYIHGRLVELKTLRNRIAHHERITCGNGRYQQTAFQIVSRGRYRRSREQNGLRPRLHPNIPHFKLTTTPASAA